MKSNSIPTIPKIRLKGDTGTIIEVDVTDLEASNKQRAAIRKFLSAGDLSVLDKKERDLIKDLKAYVGLGTIAPMLVVRFDATWVRIDE
jgi:hypothetical protein